MEYVASGDVDAEGVHMLSTGGMLDFAETHVGDDGTVIVATGDRHAPPAQARRARPSSSSPPTRPASCRYMKMITLPKLRDCLRDLTGEVRVPDGHRAARPVPIERMVAIG